MLIIYHKKEGHLSLGPSYLKCEVLAVPNGTFVFACGSSPRAIAYFVLLLWVSRLVSPWSAHSLDYPTSLSFGSLAAHRRALSPILFLFAKGDGHFFFRVNLRNCHTVRVYKVSKFISRCLQSA